MRQIDRLNIYMECTLFYRESIHTLYLFHPVLAKAKIYIFKIFSYHFLKMLYIYVYSLATLCLILLCFGFKQNAGKYLSRLSSP